MATPVALVDSRDTWGGLRDGYRRAQPGVPTSTVGQPPQFRGARNTPGQGVPPPKILASAARNNQGTNVCVPYARKSCSTQTNTPHTLHSTGRYLLEPKLICFIWELDHPRARPNRPQHQQRGIIWKFNAHLQVFRRHLRKEVL